MSDELPQGWAWAKMLDIVDCEGGSQPTKKEFIYEPREGYVRLLQIRDFGDKPFPTYVPDTKRLKKAKRDDLLLARYGGSTGSDSLGRICTGLDGAYNVALAKLIFSQDVLEKNYVRYLFLGPWFREKVSQNSRSCQTGFNRKDVEDISFPIAPLAEQRRIVAKVEKLLGKVDACEQRLAKIPALLKRFRQSVLAAACSGRLTADWREQNGLTLEDDWRDAEFSEFIEGSFYGPRFSKESYSTKGVPTIRTTDMGFDGSIELKDSPCISLSKKELERFGLQDGDLVVTRTGATIGKCALYDNSLGPAIPGAYLIRFRFKRDAIVPKFALRFLMSPKGQRLLVGGSTAVAQPNVNATTISQFVVYLPPLAEQQEIVRRVEALFALADQIEARYAKAKVHVEKLTQSILAKAFRGELVPQDPNDEPASVLLERIRASRRSSDEHSRKSVRQSRRVPREEIAFRIARR